MRTHDKLLCWTYGLLAVGALVATWSQNIRFLRQEGNGGLTGFLGDAWGTPAAASLSNDLIFLAVTVAIWMVLEARRLGIPHVWAYLLFSALVAISVTVPLFLLVRQLKLVQLERAGTGSAEF